MSAILQKKPSGRFHWKTLKGCIEVQRKRSCFSPWVRISLMSKSYRWSLYHLVLNSVRSVLSKGYVTGRTWSKQNIAKTCWRGWFMLEGVIQPLHQGFCQFKSQKSPHESFFSTEGTGRGKKFWFWTKDKLGVHLLGNFLSLSLSLFLSPSHFHTQPQKHTHAHVHSHCSSLTFAHVSFSFSLTL